MNTKSQKYLALVGVALILSVIFAPLYRVLGGQAFAQNKEKPTKVTPVKKVPLPQKGVLSRSITTGYQSQNVDMPWGGTDQSGVAVPPVSGSVSKVGERKWVIRMFNNSKDSHSVTVAVSQYSSRGDKLKTDHFSYSLKSNEKVERSISALPQTADMELALEGWRNSVEDRQEKQERNKASKELRQKEDQRFKAKEQSQQWNTGR